MKKRVLFATVVALTCALTSCMREDDWSMLSHPINITGEMHPTFGVPIGTGQMNMNDLLTSMSALYAGNIDPNSNTITVQYNVGVSDTIYALSYVPFPFPGGSKGPGAKEAFYTKDTVVETSIDIDFFNNVVELENLSMAHVYVVLSVAVDGDAPASIANHVNVVFDSMELWYDDYNGVHKQFVPTDANLSDFNVQIDDIRTGVHQTFDTMDMAPMINDRPSRLYARYHMKLNVENSIITQNIANMSIGQIIDSLGMTRVIYSANMDVKMPLSVSINDMDYSFSLDMGSGLASVNLDSILKNINEGLSAEVTMSEFTLVLDNGIPLNLTLSAYGYAADSVTRLCTLFSNEKVPAAQTAPMPNDPTVYEAISSTHKEVVASLDKTKLDQLNNSKYLRVEITVDSRDNQGALKHVAVKRSDFLNMRAYLKVHPAINVDIQSK